jgi:hypothetical protein
MYRHFAGIASYVGSGVTLGVVGGTAAVIRRNVRRYRRKNAGNR